MSEASAAAGEWSRRLAVARSFEAGTYVRRVGPTDAPGTLLYVHGLGESGHSFEPLLVHPALAAWRQLAPDLPGHGRSLWPDPPLTFSGCVDALAAWLAGAAAGPVVVLGHSMGGVLAQLLAERHPERVRGLVNVEGNISAADCIYSARIAGLSLPELLAGGFDRLLAEVYEGGVAEAPLRTYFTSLSLADPRALHRNARELVELSEEERLAGRMGALGQPSVYLLGSPRGTGAHSQGLLRAAGVAVRAIEGAGHWVYLDQPEAFVGELTSFLATL